LLNSDSLRDGGKKPYTLGEAITMKETDILIEWQDGGGGTVEIGCLTPHGQQCCGHCRVPGTDREQYAYKTECTVCGYGYGTESVLSRRK